MPLGRKRFQSANIPPAYPHVTANKTAVARKKNFLCFMPNAMAVIISAKIIPIKSCTKGCSSGRKISMELEAPIADASNCLNREMW